MPTKDFQGQRAAMVTLLRRMVETESPSEDKAAVDRMCTLVAHEIEAAGGAVERLHRDQAGDLVIGRWPGADPTRPTTLILCHLDTVWPLGTVAARPPREENGLFFGPGAYDMKAGVVIALAALQNFRQLGRQPAGPVTLLCTGDEETGSLHSRSVIESLAALFITKICY